jgi:uridine kinase
MCLCVGKQIIIKKLGVGGSSRAGKTSLAINLEKLISEFFPKQKVKIIHQGFTSKFLTNVRQIRS